MIVDDEHADLLGGLSRHCDRSQRQLDTDDGSAPGALMI
jgi:hypothetical protein